MKSSMFLVATGALLAAAGPIDKRALIVETLVEVVTETVTAEQVQTSTATQKFWGPKSQNHHKWSSSKSPDPVTTVVEPATTSTPEPVTVTVEPTSTSEVVIVANTQVAEVSSASPVVAQAAAASTTTGQEALASPYDFASTAVYHHNIHRINNSASAVSWSDEYASSASVLAATCNFHHNVTINGGGYGQNIAMWASTGDPEALGQSNAIAQATSDMWYNGEVNLFPSSDYGLASPDMTNFEAWGHYTQLVWKGTQQIGCAAQFCQAGTLSSTMGGWFTVCNYHPAGNVGGEYGSNVAAPIGEATFSAA